MAAAEASENGGRKGSTVVTLAALAALSVAAAGGGWFVGGMLAATAPAGDTEETAEAGAGGRDKKKDTAKDGEADSGRIATEDNGIVLLEPLTTNLAFPSDNWIRLELALYYADRPDVATSEEIHQDLMAYLRTVSLQQIEGPRGFAHLRQDMRERAQLRSQGRVRDVFFRTFVIE